ncbi:hypothetical protein PYW07_011815 [Mythimna separata]|uniref:Grh/CP2 DB domain-containing protein n=1 Tax=Mythimna separata TaxID=271217 RepID=A0AAD7Y6T0_MYTSE|nr:hypothetical protein PYW07_011815 [Mythimna separata]
MEFYSEERDYSMHDSRKEETYTWESSVRLALVGREEELGMYLEEREGRKRKWQGEGKMMRRDESEEKEQRKVPPKKIMAALSDMGGSGTSSSSSHMSPGWQVNDLDLDLPGELSMNEALLSLPSLAVFKQEALSPNGGGAVLSPPRRAWPARRPDDRQITNMVLDNNRDPMEEGSCEQSPPHNGNMMVQHGSPESMQCQPTMPPGTMIPMNGYHSPSAQENKNPGLLMCSPVGSLDGFLHSPIQARSEPSFKDDTRFQYVLAAATSIATKQNEETLTYLNQGQPYEIKLKKLGDLSHYKGKILKSVIKICFHERRLQYMEREQIAQWHNERPGERIVELDVPLSYGVIRVEQPACLNALHVYWDPTKDVGVYIKVSSFFIFILYPTQLDVPLSYGVIRVEQPACLNALHVYWDPTKDVGVYIKVSSFFIFILYPTQLDVPLSYGVIRVEQPACLNALHVYWDPTKDVGVYIKVSSFFIFILYPTQLDVPLSYGVIRVEQPACLNALHVYWDPTKDVGVYIKVSSFFIFILYPTQLDVPLSYGVIRVEQPACLNALHVYWDPTKDVGVYIKVSSFFIFILYPTQLDVPLSYGVIRVEQPACLNALHVYWDPTKDVGVYIKVNCISTEFTAKKHGGEKGVPFRIQVETYLASDEHTRLHAAACQIKVFKLKGADRKHKQDREKVMRRPRTDLEKYQPGCEATVLTTLSNDALMPPPSLVTTSPPYSPELCVAPKSVASPIVVNKPVLPHNAILASNSQMKPSYCQETNDVKVNSPPCHSPGAILPDLPQPAEDPEKNSGLSKEATSSETQAWLARQRFAHHAATFTNFSGADLLRLSRDDIIQICGLADGIRLFNALHAKRIVPRLTVYVCPAGSNIYSALYLHAYRAHELLHKLNSLVHSAKECETVLVSGPNGARVRLTDELVRHMPDNSTYRLERLDDCSALLLCATNNN